jgi:hypothetical protein
MSLFRHSGLDPESRTWRKYWIPAFGGMTTLRPKWSFSKVSRYDCAHGYAHMDRYDIRGNQTKRALNLQFESALTYGDWDINENWQKYRDAFLKGAENERLQ